MTIELDMDYLLNQGLKITLIVCTAILFIGFLIKVIKSKNKE